MAPSCSHLAELRCFHNILHRMSFDLGLVRLPALRSNAQGRASMIDICTATPSSSFCCASPDPLLYCPVNHTNPCDQASDVSSTSERVAAFGLDLGLVMGSSEV